LDPLDPDEPDGPEPFEFELLPQAANSIADAAMPATAAVRYELSNRRKTVSSQMVSDGSLHATDRVTVDPPDIGVRTG